MQSYRKHDVDESCAVCGLRDARVLVRRRIGAERAEMREPGETRTRTMGGEWATVCGNHAVLVTPTMTLAELRSMTPIPPSVAARSARR